MVDELDKSSTLTYKMNEFDQEINGAVVNVDQLGSKLILKSPHY